jgi:hypothetical protein
MSWLLRQFLSPSTYERPRETILEKQLHPFEYGGVGEG